MKVLICYFSGTGNTQKIVNEYQKRLQESGNEVVCHKIEKGVPQELDQYDLLGIGYPIYAFNAPSIVLDFVKSLPKPSTPLRTFVVTTSGEPIKLNNISSIKAVRLLKKRNYHVENEYHYCMPYNMIFRHSDEMAYQMWNVAQQLVPLDVADLVSGKKHLLDKVFAGALIASIMRIQHWGGRFNGRRYKVVKDKCIGCKKCVNICPVGNVTMDEKGNVKFGKKCVMCVRCSFNCPTNAINIGLVNGWKINGAYSFEETHQPNTQRYNRMLTKAYKKYFTACEKRLAEHNAATQQTDND